jgi:hypothetical protein
MSTRTENVQLDRAQLRDRIEHFYRLLNDEQWKECFEFVDPKLRDEGRITQDAYTARLSAFVAAFGPLAEVSVGELKLYSDVASELYGDRDFAHGSVTWKDRNQAAHQVQERWVKAADGRWYTRMIGVI